VQKACELILDIVLSVSELEMVEYEQSERLPHFSASGRHLLMLQCTEKEFLPYCIKMLVSCLKVGYHCADILRK
jgi:hypothetical protein